MVNRYVLSLLEYNTIEIYRLVENILIIKANMHCKLNIISAKKEDTGRVDRAQWKAMVNTMSDSTKFVDMLHNVSWEDGLPEDVLRGKYDLILSM